jgi:hypothetical protein
MKTFWLPALSGCLLASAATSGVSGKWFEEIATESGLTHRHHKRSFDNPYAEVMQGYTALGASVAVSDFDGDGFDDLFLTDSSADGHNRLYRNDGGLRFIDITAGSGIGSGNDARNASADALWFDYNNDGRPDLFVARFGRSLFYENLGQGKFRERSREAGIAQYRNAITAIAFDYDRDGDLDLFIGSYFQPIDIFQPKTPRFFPENFETANNGGGVTVFRNGGDGRFADVTALAGIRISGWTLDLGHADFDNDGDDDLYVAADFGTDRFFVNNGDGTFRDATVKAIGIDTKKGMNADWGDYDNDGLLDAYVTNITDDYMREGNFLWRNNGDGTLLDVSRETGTHNTGWGWGAKFFDYDNDGWLDLYVTNGWVSGSGESYVPDIFKMIIEGDGDFSDARKWPPMGTKSLSGHQKNRLFHNEGDGLFREVAENAGLDSTLDGRGIGVTDYNNDGQLDLVVANAGAAVLLYRNELPLNQHWAGFLLRGTRSNREAIGAQVRLTAGGMTQLRFVDGGNSFAGQSSRRLHFGLGKSGKIEKLEVRWPSGQSERFAISGVDRTHTLVEGKGTR